MTRLVRGPVAAPAARRGFTLVEMLVATTLTLIMMFAAVQVFGLVGDSVNDSRATLEMSERLRATARRLQMDLEGVTVTMLPPRSPGGDEGYFEIVEGAARETVTAAAHVMPLYGASGLATDSETSDTPPRDTTVIDFDDILMFTTRSTDRPFVGRLNATTTAESRLAEVAWFVRGGRLYRRVLLVLPNATNLPGAVGYYANSDVSARYDATLGVVANTLGDLTKRENRYAHPAKTGSTYPWDVRWWGNDYVSSTFYGNGLPTLGETSNGTWTLGAQAPGTPPAAPNQIDFWMDPQPEEGTLASVATSKRVYEDVILDHVIGFDIKVWDPHAPLVGRSGSQVGLGAYVDLGGPGAVDFATPDSKSQLIGTYDTGSDHYEYDASYGNNRIANGFDDDSDGVVDDVGPDGENVTSPPYWLPLRGIQIRIRVFEPDSRQVREVTLVQDF